jgi:hypothetical protein
MTAAQKKARENFSKAIAYRKKTGCTLKQAFAHVKGASVKGLDKVVKKGNKTSVIYTKKAAPKKKVVAKKKVVKQGSLFGTLKLTPKEKRLGLIKKTPMKKKIGAINLSTVAKEFDSLDFKLYKLKQEKKYAKTIKEKKILQQKITVLNKQHKALKVYLNTIAVFR